MSRHTRRAKIDELTEELCIGAAMQMRCDSDEIRPIVQAVVAYLISEYPSQDLYIPAMVPTQHPVEKIRADVASGKSIRSICQRYRIDRRTVYRLLGEDFRQTG